MPGSLRDRIAADLRPVRPLLPPWQRAAILAPLGIALLVGTPLWWQVRGDARDLGPLLLWGLSSLQVLTAVLLLAAALRDVVPGRALSARANAALLSGGIALAVAVTFLTWQASPSLMPAGAWARYTYLCFAFSFRDGLPVLLVFLAFAARGLLARPLLVGSLVGLAAGLMSDAGWRAFCSISEPSHVLVGHIGAVAGLAAAGAAISWAWARLIERRHTSIGP
jgi:hypothetical protein